MLLYNVISQVYEKRPFFGSRRQSIAVNDAIMILVSTSHSRRKASANDIIMMPSHPSSAWLDAGERRKFKDQKADRHRGRDDKIGVTHKFPHEYISIYIYLITVSAGRVLDP